MKKTYLTPAIETTEVMVEQGIAQSTLIIEQGGINGPTYSEEDIEW